jgi:dTDP-4-dehydrorhamnose 3,5-epimerase
VEVKRLEIPDVLVFSPLIHGDERGYFMESFRADVMNECGVTAEFVQDNMSSSRYGVLRGLHYQLEPHAQGKLVRVFSGKVFDVAVDIRKNSPWYGKWAGHILSAENKCSMYVPPGFAHGFCVMSETAEFYYKCTNYYAPHAERGLAWNDATVSIQWPVPTNCLILSDRDKVHPCLRDIETHFEYSPE